MPNGAVTRIFEANYSYFLTSSTKGSGQPAHRFELRGPPAFLKPQNGRVGDTGLIRQVLRREGTPLAYPPQPGTVDLHQSPVPFDTGPI